jgi:phage portal protein BeeE
MEYISNWQSADVQKSMMAFTIEQGYGHGRMTGRDQRGLNVYNYSSLVAQAARDKYGNIQSAEYLLPYFSLSVAERIDMVRACGPIFGVITGRMSRVSSLQWKIITRKKDHDRIETMIKTARDMFNEGLEENTPEGIGRAISARAYIAQYLTDIRPDISNFDKAFLRWMRNIKQRNEDRCSEIEDWLRQPNQEDTIEDFFKKLVFDVHVHGLAVPYKKRRAGLIQNLYILPGGSCYPIHGRHIGDPTGIVQVVDGAEAQLYFTDEANALRYAPYSGDPYGLIPLESLVNNVAEILLFQERAASMADGTKPPEKLIAFGDKTPWLQGQLEMPMNKDEQKRIETMVNEARKEAVRVISGHGTPQVVDVSRADTFQYQSERQRMVREEVGLVFGASNIEMNLSGSDSTSGRSTSESQERSEIYKGVFPHVQMIENFFNFEVLPQRYGSGYEFKFSEMLSEAEQLKFWTEKYKSGIFTLNEIRMEDIGRDGFGVEYDKPPKSGASEQISEPSVMEGVL